MTAPRSQRVATLLDVMSGLASATDPEQLLAHALEAAVGLVEGCRGGLYLSRDGDELVVRAAVPVTAAAVGDRFPLAGTTAAQLLSSGEWVGTGARGQLPEVEERVLPGTEGRWAVAVTAAHPGARGSLYLALDEGPPLQRDQLDVLELLAAQGEIVLHQAERLALSREHQRSQQRALDTMADGLAVLDPDGLVTTWNRALTAMTGVPREEALGRPLPFPVPETGESVRGAATGRWLEARAAPYDETGARVVTVRDVTRNREAEEAKDLFLATASHELRTPLTAMRGTGETLLHRWDLLDEERRRELVSTIVARTKGMAELVEQLLLGSHAGGGLENPEVVFDLAADVRAVGPGLAALSVRHPLRVEADRPVEVVGDPAALEPVLGQLVENAIRYSPDGGPVEVTVHAEDRYGVLTVADRGVGIPPEALERVFERFVRAAPQVRRGRSRGAGLGLWIVRRYVEAQAGRVRAVPRSGGGTVLEVRLPLA